MTFQPHGKLIHLRATGLHVIQTEGREKFFSDIISSHDISFKISLS